MRLLLKHGGKIMKLGASREQGAKRKGRRAKSKEYMDG
jgi:hypothetical protein